ncbi:MAG: threonine-phosphate decarboxylase CobD, partial [Pseudomonadota bacterium]
AGTDAMNRDLRHGGALDAMSAAYPDTQKPWIDLSTGINPWPYPEASISEQALTRLPTRTFYTECRDAMAAAIGAQPESLLLSSGSEVLIRLLPDVLSPARVAILQPIYADHIEAWSRTGADIIQTDDPLAYAASVDAIVLSHPNNPDGRLFDYDALSATLTKLRARGSWLIIDEAYADLAPELSFAPRGGEDNLIILRSFGKFYGLPGLRLGGVLAPERVRRALADRLGVWPVSGAALEIGARAYRDVAWQQQMRARLVEGAARLDEILKAAKMKRVGGTHLYRFVEVESAHEVFDTLAKAGIYVRRFDWSPTHLRIGLPPTADAETRLKEALSL